MQRTLLEKIWDAHLVTEDDPKIIFVDMHLTHEVTSPQAFEGLRESGRSLRRPDLTLATADHDVPTDTTALPGPATTAGRQLRLQQSNCDEFGVPLFGMGSPDQGIVHVIGPERGLTMPGMTIVCGDSHTSTHGAFGAVAFGIGTTQVEHVMATQTLRMRRPLAMLVELTGRPAPGVDAKDIALGFLAAVGTNGGTGHIIEFVGEAVRAMSIEGRMTLCNMAIEAGAVTGMVAPDAVTVDYLRSRFRSPHAGAWEQAQRDWTSLRTDEGAHFDKRVAVDVAQIRPQLTWGITPSQSIAFDELIPDPGDAATASERADAVRALDYTGLRAGSSPADVRVSTVFIGSCTNGRIEDLRAAATVLAGHSVADGVRAIVVPGSVSVQRQAAREGLDEVFRAAGFEWRNPGCSMCIAMNGDRAEAGSHVASTSNRNFINRQGPGVRTHLMSPRSAAAVAVTGRLSLDLA